MEAINVNDVISHPLAGCLTFTTQPGSYTTLVDSLYLRLCVIHGKRVSTYIFDQINLEGEKIIIFKKEYVINELQYEIRHWLLKEDPQCEYYESEIIDAWAEKLLSKLDTDAVLDFIVQLKQFRARRNRVK